MEACEVVRLFVNKPIVSAEPKRRGNPGYGPLKAIRVLVFARLKGLENDTRVVENLEKHSDDARILGLIKVPDRTTFGRWWRRYLHLLVEAFGKISNMLQLVAPNTLLIADSTPLEDLYDMEARWGYTSRGKFRGFKLHTLVNQLGLSIKAVVTSGHRYDSPFLSGLLWDLEVDYVLAVAGYDSKRNHRVVESIGAEPVIASNPRKGKRKKIAHAVLLKTKRYTLQLTDYFFLSSKLNKRVNCQHK